MLPLRTIFPLSDVCDEDAGWWEHEDMCYYISSTSEEADLTWHEAHAQCREMGGDLASIHTENETRLIYLMVSFHIFSGCIGSSC